MASASSSHGENPSKTSLLQDDHFTSVRRRNKALIIFFFSIVICLAVFVGGSIISLAVKNNITPKSLAIREFCSVAPPHFDCAHHFASRIRASSHPVPYHIFLLSLESALEKLVRINSTIFDFGSDSGKPKIGSVFKNCSVLLLDARTQLGSVSAVAWANWHMEMIGLVERNDMVTRMEQSIGDLRNCSLDLKNVKLPSTDLGEIDLESVGEVGAIVDSVEDLVMSSKDFLRDGNWINRRFYRKLAEISRTRFVETMMEVTIFGSQYWVLIFLFFLFFVVRK